MRFTTKAILVMTSLVLAAGSISAQPRPGGGGPKPPTGGGGGAPGGPGSGGGGGIIVKIQAEQIAQLFTEAGFESKVVDNQNTHMVQTSFWPSQVFSGAIPEFCEKDNSGCHAYMIFANLGSDSGVDDAWIAAWNNNSPFVHAYKLQNGALIFAWHVGVLTGVTPDYIKATAQIFKLFVDKTTDFKP